MPFRLLFKQAFVWGVGAQMGAILIQSVTAKAKVLFNKTKKDNNSTK